MYGENQNPPIKDVKKVVGLLQTHYPDFQGRLEIVPAPPPLFRSDKNFIEKLLHPAIAGYFIGEDSESNASGPLSQPTPMGFLLHNVRLVDLQRWFELKQIDSIPTELHFKFVFCQPSTKSIFPIEIINQDKVDKDRTLDRFYQSIVLFDLETMKCSIKPILIVYRKVRKTN